MNLVIVESPTKAKTISRFLGKEYTVLASFGHVRDLPKSKIGVDVEKGFEPTYVVSKDHKEKVNAITKAAKKPMKIAKERRSRGIWQPYWERIRKK
jgi:DNA topoisomerase I